MKTNKKKITIVFFSIILIYLAYMIYKVRFGLHFDEGYLVDLGKIKTDGLKSISECWDILQMGGVILYPFMSLYLKIYGSYEGVILFIRYAYLIIHFIISLYAYFVIRQIWSNIQAIAVFLLSFSFVFHWYTICYKSILFWGTFLCVLFLLCYLKRKKRGYLCVSAIVLNISIPTYPTMILLWIPILWFIFKQGYNRKREICIFSISGIITLGVIAIALIIEASPTGFFENLKYSASYEGSTDSKHKLVTIISIAAIMFAGTIIYLLYKKLAKIIKHLPRYIDFAWFLALLFLVVICLVKRETAGISRFWYGFLFYYSLTFPALYRSNTRHIGWIRGLFFHVSFWLMFIISISTANGLAVGSYGSILGLMGIVISGLDKTEEYKLLNSMKRMSIVLVGIFVFSAVFFVPDNETGASNILWQRQKISYGSGKGIYVSSNTLDKYDDVCRITKKNTSDNDIFFILTDGFRCYGLLESPAKQIGCWPYIVDADSEYIVQYFNMHYKPTVLIIDKDYIEESNYQDFDLWEETSPFGKYIRNNMKLVNSTTKWYIYR